MGGAASTAAPSVYRREQEVFTGIQVLAEEVVRCADPGDSLGVYAIPKSPDVVKSSEAIHSDSPPQAPPGTRQTAVTHGAMFVA